MVWMFITYIYIYIYMITFQKWREIQSGHIVIPTWVDVELLNPQPICKCKNDRPRVVMTDYVF